MVAPLTPDQARLAAIREALPALGAGIYLNTASAGPLPAETARAMAEIESVELTYGRGHPSDPIETAERVGEARAAVSAVLGSDLEAVALTTGTEHALAMVLQAAEVAPGDLPLTGVVESEPGDAVHGGDATGFVRFPAGADDDAILAAFDRAISPQARLVVIPHVLPESGRVLPVARIADAARGRGALVAVDAGCSAGAIRVSPDELGADALVLPGERWLLGPLGTGALWCGPRMLERSRSLYPGGYLDGSSAAGDTAWNRALVVGLARSCGWLSMQVGLAWAWTRTAELARRAAAALRTIPGVAILTPTDAMAAIVTLRIAGWPAPAALDELGSRVFAIAGLAPRRDAIRVSLGCYNSEEEVGRFVEGVALLAAHTPATLPPRRTLNVLS